MLAVNDEQRLRAGVCSLNELCTYCSKAFAEYRLIMSDDAEQTVYHAACALQLATEILVDLFTFFRPPAPIRHVRHLRGTQASARRDARCEAISQWTEPLASRERYLSRQNTRFKSSPISSL